MVPGDMPSEIPDLWRYLIEYPKQALPGAEDVFYWNKGEFGMKPTIRLNHVTIYPVPHPRFPDPLRFVVATSQIYSNHYFSATLELRSIVDDPERPGQRLLPALHDPIAGERADRIHGHAAAIAGAQPGALRDGEIPRGHEEGGGDGTVSACSKSST